MNRKTHKPEPTYIQRARAEYSALALEDLEAMVLAQSHEAAVEHAMAAGFGMSADLVERRMEKMAIAEAVLVERLASARALVDAAFAR